MKQLITRREMLQAQLALIIAIALQFVVLKINEELLLGPQFVLIPTEIALAVLVGFTVNRYLAHKYRIHHAFVLILLGLVSVGNVGSLMLVLHSLIVGHATISGTELLASAVVIFITNIIVYALWYWEIDSPGFTRKRWSKNDKDFQFPQQDKPEEFPGWRTEFLDYLYLSLTNAINFAPAEAKPLTHSAKMLMGSQALVSVFTLALVIARSVSILGA
jgi:uncharacterized membrane protein